MTMDSDGPRLVRGDESFTGLDATVSDFWRFAVSDLRTNSVRGHLAEFLAARAVGATGPRVEWDLFDVLAPGGTRIEVKSTGHVQAWPQAVNPRTPSWPIARTVPYDVVPYDAARADLQADVYVFALHIERNEQLYDATNAAQWVFHVLSRAQIEALPRGAKGHALATLPRIQQVAPAVAYIHLAAAIAAAHAP